MSVEAPAEISTATSSVVSLHGVSKTYTIWDEPSARLLALLRSLLPGAKPTTGGRPFTAVQEVSLDIRRGECLGIIGRNGAGKSTLLQIIAGTLTPTTGDVTVRGRVAALLELGSGFNPDFTGRENIHLNASILGLTKSEIDAKFDAIVAYSGIEEFIDQPVRTYSSGMALRLAFSVCAHVDADVLIIDEALAVGDARFAFKCHATLDQMIADGRTIIFVSHDTNARCSSNAVKSFTKECPTTSLISTPSSSPARTVSRQSALISPR
jgi:lipopolysaccharide transport system ATP-binding protein